MMRGAFCLLAVLLLTGAATAPPKPENLPPAEGARQGRALVAEILSQKPAHSLTNSGVMTIRGSRKLTQIPIEFAVVVTSSNWLSIYSAKASKEIPYAAFTVVHPDGGPSEYWAPRVNSSSDTNGFLKLKPANLMNSFAGSDFWLADLGLEFLNWPEQRLLRTEMKRSRSCRMLESTNPQPAPGAYARVVSWIDIESNGIVHADAYDARGKLLKQFDPKDFKKVNGEWQLEEMEILNRQTDSRTRVEFVLDSKPVP